MGRKAPQPVPAATAAPRPAVPGRLLRCPPPGSAQTPLPTAAPPPGSSTAPGPRPRSQLFATPHPPPPGAVRSCRRRLGGSRLLPSAGSGRSRGAQRVPGPGAGAPRPLCGEVSPTPAPRPG
ncbi:hypothetical protein KIL84_019878 [Mauremys mutica]|uniref:Uncharacterized protein n=1 Tax=Mauremys mutica TaxID=74926 RepID=A0A9D3XUM1_9SAUR|nr:hypothetical protein KIL84_019878 [Mauremys mutica]